MKCITPALQASCLKINIRISDALYLSMWGLNPNADILSDLSHLLMSSTAKICRYTVNKFFLPHSLLNIFVLFSTLTCCRKITFLLLDKPTSPSDLQR